MLISLISVGVLSVLERTILAATHSREGPIISVGNGFVQLILDGIKLYSKASRQGNNTIIAVILNIAALTILAVSIIAVILSLGLTGIAISTAVIITVLLDGISIISEYIVSAASKSLWASAGSIRGIKIDLLAGIVIDLVGIFIIALIPGIGYSEYSNRVNISSVAVITIGVLIVIIGSGKSPADVSESESELIAGILAELGGASFSLAVVSEYIELIAGIILLGIIGISVSISAAISMTALVTYTYYGRILLVRINIA